MMMKYIISIALLTFLFGCENNTNNQLELYLTNKGYQINSFEGKVDNYVLTKKKLLTKPYMMYWGLQTTDPSKYLNHNIQVVKFIVTNHPISKGKVYVYVFVVDGVPIGGISARHNEEVQEAGVFSLDGKTLEEIQGKSYQQWMSDWNTKFNVS
jgi:hypothetical protein